MDKGGRNMTMEKLFPVALGIVLIGIVGFGYGLWAHSRTWDARSWPTVDGVVTDSKVESTYSTRKGKSRTRYYAKVTYEYKVNEKKFISNRVNLVEGEKTGSGKRGVSTRLGLHSTSRTSANNVIRRYPRGSTVKVFYNPAAPADAALEIKMPMLVDLGLWAGIPIAIIGLLAFFWIKKNMKATEPEK